MKRAYISLFLSLAFFTITFCGTPGKDSLDKPSVKYTKKEWKKESDDVKAFDKQIKEWNKALKKPNADYLNTLYSRIMETLYKEHNELSSKISSRSKKMHPGSKMNEKDSLLDSEKPKAYNPELKDQPTRISKEEIFRRKAESDYLSKYVALVKAETNLLQKFKKVETFTKETNPSVYTSISDDLIQFKAKMKVELDLMKPETSKK